MASTLTGVEIAGIVLAVVPLFIAAAEDVFASNWNDYGSLHTILLYTIFWKARAVIQRIRTHVVIDGYRARDPENQARQAKEALAVQNSYTASFNMISVAGAILAQIAITALSLDGVSELHWTVTATFLSSLIAGLLSVYYACIIQVRLSGMHSPDDVRQWLTARRRISSDVWYEFPSYYSALLLIAPGQLLNWSVSSLLVGIGVYYGLIFTENLGTLRGTNANLAVLLVYILFTAGAVATFVLPDVAKLLETMSSELDSEDDGHRSVPGPNIRTRTDVELGMLRESARARDGHDHVTARTQVGTVRELHRDGSEAVVAALQASITAQTASLEAQQHLLRAYQIQDELATTTRRHSL